MALKEFTREAGGIIGPFGGAFMLHPETSQRGMEVGLDGMQFYFLGRGGALGDVDASVVSDHFHFFNPDIVTTFWNSAREKMTTEEAAGHYAAAAAAWGRDRLANVEHLDRFCEQAQRIVDAADVDGVPLFEGWRKIPPADDAPGRALQLIHILRELRGSCHVLAVDEVGLEPLQALTANSPHMVALLGWPAPAEGVDELRGLIEKAEDITDDLVGPAFSVLDEGERASFLETLKDCAAAAGI